MSSRTDDLRHAPPSQVLAALQSASTLSDEDLRAALANAFERIESMEREWEGLGQAFRWLHENLRESNRSQDISGSGGGRGDP